MSYSSHYGKGINQDVAEQYLPGSPDARRRQAYMRDAYDDTSTSYGKKISTKKNKVGFSAPNNGIQGSQESGKKAQTQEKSVAVKGTGRTHKSSYGTKIGNQLDNTPGANFDSDYGKRSK